MGEGKGQQENMIERAHLENKVFDRLQTWKQFHPRTFWPMVDAIADLLEGKPDPEFSVGEFGNGTGTISNCAVTLEA